MKRMLPVDELARDERFSRIKVEDFVFDPRNAVARENDRRGGGNRILTLTELRADIAQAYETSGAAAFDRVQARQEAAVPRQESALYISSDPADPLFAFHSEAALPQRAAE